MKKLISKSVLILKNKKAESFAEVMVSILIFIIFMLAAGSMLMASTTVTSKTTRDAAVLQEKLNKIVIGETTGTEKELTLKGVGIDVKVEVELVEDGYTAFAPKKVVEP